MMPFRNGIAAGLVLVLILLAAACATPRDSAGPIAVAIWDLDNLGGGPNADVAMGSLLASRVAAYVETVPGYRVVERQALVNVLEELNLGSSELADEPTRLRLGNVIGARQMVFGAFQEFGGVLRVDLRRVDVASGKILSTATATTSVQGAGGILDAVDEAARSIITP
jgi:hypothetical protein